MLLLSAAGSGRCVSFATSVVGAGEPLKVEPFGDERRCIRRAGIVPPVDGSPVGGPAEIPPLHSGGFSVRSNVLQFIALGLLLLILVAIFRHGFGSKQDVDDEE